MILLLLVSFVCSGGTALLPAPLEQMHLHAVVLENLNTHL